MFLPYAKANPSGAMTTIMIITRSPATSESLGGSLPIPTTTTGRTHQDVVWSPGELQCAGYCCSSSHSTAIPFLSSVNLCSARCDQQSQRSRVWPWGRIFTGGFAAWLPLGTSKQPLLIAKVHHRVFFHENHCTAIIVWYCQFNGDDPTCLWGIIIIIKYST